MCQNVSKPLPPSIWLILCVYYDKVDKVGGDNADDIDGGSGFDTSKYTLKKQHKIDIKPH